MIDLIGSFIIAADAWTGNIQNEMDARYVEQSSLTNLFTEHKFWGWAGLLLIFVAIAAIFYFQFQAWEQEDQEQEELTQKQKEFVEFLEKASNQSKNDEWEKILHYQLDLMVMKIVISTNNPSKVSIQISN